MFISGLRKVRNSIDGFRVVYGCQSLSPLSYGTLRRATIFLEIKRLREIVCWADSHIAVSRLFNVKLMRVALFVSVLPFPQRNLSDLPYKPIVCYPEGQPTVSCWHIIPTCTYSTC